MTGGEEQVALGREVAGVDPEREAMLADAVGPALLVVLDLLTPAERLAFVLHDMFAVPFDEIAPIVGEYERTSTVALNSRQCAAPSASADKSKNPSSTDTGTTNGEKRFIAAHPVDADDPT